jgi:pectate lyase
MRSTIFPAFAVLASCLCMHACLDPAEGPPQSSGIPDPADYPDGWASAAGAPASPGGYGAAESNTYTVKTRSEFIDALRCGGASLSDSPKIIYVEGMIDLCADDSNNTLDAVSFIKLAGYGGTYANYQAYMDAYAASCASGAASTLANVQNTLYNTQKAYVVLKIGSNTSILGIGQNAGFKKGSLSISGKTNVVIRNVSVLDAYDYFPEWDGGEELINSEYDNISVSGSTYVWIDHCNLGDGDRPDSLLPSVTIPKCGLRKWVTHDGLIDVVRGADYVTVSWNRFENHDKTMLFGNSDSADATDTGKIKVTVHHNYFNGVNQRLPRVRFGQVHVYNNYYVNVSNYAVGVGVHARIYSEANYFNAIANAFATYDDAANLGYYYDVGSANVKGDKAMASEADVGW